MPDKDDLKDKGLSLLYTADDGPTCDPTVPCTLTMEHPLQKDTWHMRSFIFATEEDTHLASNMFKPNMFESTGGPPKGLVVPTVTQAIPAVSAAVSAPKAPKAALAKVAPAAPTKAPEAAPAQKQTTGASKGVVIWEIACCSVLEQVVPFHCEYEECVVLRENHDNTCNVRLGDGTVCDSVPWRFLRKATPINGGGRTRAQTGREAKAAAATASAPPDATSQGATSQNSDAATNATQVPTNATQVATNATQVAATVATTLSTTLSPSPADASTQLLHPTQDNRAYYNPSNGLSDLAPAIKNGVCKALPSISQWRGCWAHTWRATMANRGKLKDSSKESVDLLFTDISYVHEIVWEPLRETLVPMLLAKWVELGEGSIAEYLAQHILVHRFSRCHSTPGKPTDTNTLEGMNRVLKGVDMFNTVEGLGTVLANMGPLLSRMSSSSRAFAHLPCVTQKNWMGAQELLNSGIMHLSFTRTGGSFILPSKELLKHIPKSLTTMGERKNYVKTWANEYKGLSKNPSGYKKLHDKSWGFDEVVDMAFSFWTVTPIPEEHPKCAELRGVGILYTCTCPTFQHYFTCKHVLAVAVHNKQVVVPTVFNSDFVGKRKAPAGASLSKRGKCLKIDD